MQTYERKEWAVRKEENHTVGQQIKINSSQSWGDERSSKYILSLPLTSSLPEIWPRSKSDPAGEDGGRGR